VSQLLVGVDGGQGIFASPDQGLTWSNVLSGESVRGIASLGSTLHAVCASGNHYASTNGGTTWTLVDTVTESLWCLRATGDKLFAGGDTRLWMWNGSWSAAVVGASTIYALATFESNVICQASNGQISVSTDDGVTWNQPAITYSGSGGAFINGVMAVVGLFSGGEFTKAPSPLYDSWTNFNGGLPMYVNPQQLCFDGTSLYAALYEEGVWKTSDFVNWENATNNLADTDSVAMMQAGAATYAGSTNGVLSSSSNGGASWSTLRTFAGRIWAIFNYDSSPSIQRTLALGAVNMAAALELGEISMATVLNV
jgi:hypothetical protein